MPNVQAIAVGYNHAGAIAGVGANVFMWGENADGQLGDGTALGHSSPATTLVYAEADEEKALLAMEQVG